MLRIPAIEIVMVRCQGNQVLSSRALVQLDERLGVPSFRFPEMADALLSELRWMAIMLHVILLLGLPLNVHIPRIPIALFGHALRAPVRPDSELCVAKPIGAAV